MQNKKRAQNQKAQLIQSGPSKWRESPDNESPDNEKSRGGAKASGIWNDGICSKTLSK